MKEVLIKVRNLNKVFSIGKTKVHALKNINMDIYSGEYLSVMGPSGSGKSTLFNMIGALDNPTSGTVRIVDIELVDLSSRELAYFRGNHIGYIFQSYNLISAYSAIDNVMMPILFSGVSYKQAKIRAEEVLVRVGLSNRMMHRPDELSGGQQQRVAIARALANRPSIILADEPTGNLDMHTGKTIIKLLKELSAKEGVTVITATHDHKMFDVSSKIVWIKDGEIEKIQKREDINVKVGSVR